MAVVFVGLDVEFVFEVLLEMDAAGEDVGLEQADAAVFSVVVVALFDGEAPAGAGLAKAGLFVADETAEGFLEAVGFEPEFFVLVALMEGEDLLDLA